MVKVPFLDLGASYVELRREIDEAVQRVLDSGWYVLGREVEAFEEEFAHYVGASCCVAVGSGLDALKLALIALGIGPGDDVLVPTHTFVATWLAVTAVGARPVPVEPDPLTFNLDPNRLEGALTVGTRAVIPVHLYGQPADLEPIASFAERHGLAVLADAAQAHGARYQGRPIGAVCTSAWSFYPAKNLGAFGDGGAITTDDPVVADRLRMLRNYGSRLKYEHAISGSNSRLDEIQAAILRVKLRYLDSWNDRRCVAAERYRDALIETPVELPSVLGLVEPVWHLFVIRTRYRDQLRRHLELLEIGTGIHYPKPPHLQRAFSDLGYFPGSFPIAEGMAEQVLSLPIGPHLASVGLERVVAAVRRFFANRPAAERWSSE